MLRIITLSTLLLCAGCTTTEQSTELLPEAPGSGGAPIARPWTTTFEAKAVLIANVVRIEGPPGLIDHVATRPVAGSHALKTETVPEGFSQIILALDPARGIEIQAVLDQVQIMAMQKLEVLERPGDVPVILSASGDVFYRTDAGEEQRGANLRIVGTAPK